MTSPSKPYEHRERWQRVQHPISWADRFLRKAEVRKFMGLDPSPEPKQALSVYVTPTGMQFLFYMGVRLTRVTQTLVWQGCQGFAIQGGCNVMAEAMVEMGATDSNFALLPLSKGLRLCGMDLPVQIVHTCISEGMWKVTFMAHAYMRPMRLGDGQD